MHSKAMDNTNRWMHITYLKIVLVKLDKKGSDTVFKVHVLEDRINSIILVFFKDISISQHFMVAFSNNPEKYANNTSVLA